MERTHRFALGALVLVGLMVRGGDAQIGKNFHVLSNGIDVIYTGIGAGGTQVPRVDGLGFWVGGEDLIGHSLVGPLGEPGSFYGYKQSGFRLNACVLGPPVAGLQLNFPAIVFSELNGRNSNDPDVFLRPGITTLGPLGMTSGGFIPYGTPPGTSASFVLSGLPSTATGSATGVSSSQVVLLPNNGIFPSSAGNGGVATIMAATSASLPINSTGFCWTVQFEWLNSALAATAMSGVQDHTDGWWCWLSNGTAGNQYWSMSNDEMNVFQSQSIALDGGATSLIAFFANLDYVTHMLSTDPNTNDALAPSGWQGTGVYYTGFTNEPSAGSPANGGFDLGRHLGFSVDGTGGVPNPITGVGNQDPSASPLSPTPSLGFVTFADTASSGAPGAVPEGSTGWRITWWELDWDVTFGVDPDLASWFPVFFGLQRVPIPQPFSQPSPWFQPITIVLLPFYVHQSTDQQGNPIWMDPDGFPGGSFEAPIIVGSSLHIPFLGFGPLDFGLPLAYAFGTSGLLSSTGPLTWNPAIAPVSIGKTENMVP